MDSQKEKASVTSKESEERAKDNSKRW
jgi:hypothetical protein